MATNYPFSNNHRAQSDHTHAANGYNYYPEQDQYEFHDASTGQEYDNAATNDRSSVQQHGADWGQNDAARYNDNGGYRGTDSRDLNAPQGYGQNDYNEKNAATGAGIVGGYGRKSRFGQSNRDSVFSADDRHVFFRRSWPVRTLRTLFCIIICAIIIIITVVLLVITFALPPNVALLSVNVPTTDDFSISGSTFSANGSINFAISNPNPFSATINHITANVYDAALADSTSIGNGSLIDQKIAGNANTTVVFPFDIGLDVSSSGETLIDSVVSQCGIGTTSSTGQKLTALIQVSARITVLSVGVNIPISRNVSFSCPTSELTSILESLTGKSSAAAAVAALTGSSSRRSLAEVLAGKEGQLEARGGLSLLPEGEKFDWELNRREIFRQLLEPWFPRAAAESAKTSDLKEEVERRSLNPDL
ncbi:hypothetical protein BCV69DRAFT_310103 [Microstroma glucosiphilum]|uniref:Late embryogenesis abundant protein LEA-2 subgroup domain-containing protein n=1 Tax=Pseudomicrostroma glucosiphilum TaxID=1684307 RepID=A0A316UM52_9BASI|nr:hypothetical protein BCV69DRAFT_310103 [Pseudomicrostroma glucosiphilum]PWN24275.1 hypothetical protein BCV69DRAFT_310103 [Pseudomicrostroma glucosiphilum]